MPWDTKPARVRTPVLKTLTDATEQTVLAAPADLPTGVGQKNVVYGLVISNTGAGASRFDVKDDTTVLFQVPTLSGTTVVLMFPVAWTLTTAKALKVQQTAAQTGAVTALYDVRPDPE